MNITEKAAYLKGLAKGLEIDESTKEGKLLLALIDAFELMADEIADLQEVCDELDEVVDVLDEDLTSLEEEIYELDDDDDHDCGCEDEMEDMYEVVCPSCKDRIYLDEGMIAEGSLNCPNCKELLEFEMPEGIELDDSGKADDTEKTDEE